MLDPDGLPLALLRDADGSPRQVALALPGGRALTARVWQPAGRPRAAAAARHRRPRERRGCPRRHRPALRRRRRAPPAAGDCCSASAACARCGSTRALAGRPRRGLPHQRGPRRLPRARAHQRPDRRGADLRRGARGRARRHGLHHPHARSRRHRPVRRRPHRALLRRRPAAGRRRRRRARARRRGLRGGDPGVFNMAVMGLRLAQRANGVSKLHGDVSRRHVRRALAGLRRRATCRSPRSPTACTPRPGPTPGARRSPRAKLGTSDTTAADWDRRRCRDRRRAVARRARACARSSSHDARRRLRAAWLERGAAQRRARLDRRARSTPTC